MKGIGAAGRLSALIVLVALVSSCAAGSGTSTGPEASASAPDPSTHISQPADAVPYTVVATDGPQTRGRMYAATSMIDLPAQVDGVTCRSSGPCYATATPPASSLLVLFGPVQLACQSATGYDVSLVSETLTIDVSGIEDCGTATNVLLPAARTTTLLAIPLAALPSSGTLTIVVNSFQGKRGGWPQATTTVNLG
jgi:hypothetical protein